MRLKVRNPATASALTAIENKIPNVSYVIKKLAITQKLTKFKRKLQIIIKINILLIQNLIHLRQTFLL